MTYKDILTRVANNLSLPSITSAFLSIGKKDIFDTLTVLTQQHEHVTGEKTITITTDSEEISLSTEMPDFYSPLELAFFDADGNQYYTKEVLPETFIKWNPNVEVSVVSFSELVTDATPETMLWTPENELLDGYIGYTFTDDYPQKLKWKPAIAGTIKIIYVRYPIMQQVGYGYNYGFNYATTDLMTALPNLHPAFHLMIVESVTLKMLYRKLLEKGLTEINLLGIRELINMHQKEFNSQSERFGAFVKKTATFEAKSVEFFDFLNDRGMLL